MPIASVEFGARDPGLLLVDPSSVVEKNEDSASSLCLALRALALDFSSSFFNTCFRCWSLRSERRREAWRPWDSNSCRYLRRSSSARDFIPSCALVSSTMQATPLSTKSRASSGISSSGRPRKIFCCGIWGRVPINTPHIWCSRRRYVTASMENSRYLPDTYEIGIGRVGLSIFSVIFLSFCISSVFFFRSF